MHIVHIQCLLQVDGSILAGVYLTSSFCVVLLSFLQRSLLVAWYTRTALVQLALSQQCIASFKTFALEEEATEAGGCSVP